MEYVDLPRYFSSLGLVIALILGVAYLAKRLNLSRFLATGMRSPTRLDVVERLFIDAKHRILIIRCDTREHVVLFGAGYCQLLESREIRNQQNIASVAGE